MSTTTNGRSWRSLLIDNFFGIAGLLSVLILSFMISSIGFSGFLLFLSGVPLVLAMIPLSFIELLLPDRVRLSAKWWFLAAFTAWAISPVLGGWLYPLLNSLGDQPAIVSDPGEFVVWTQWLWALPFLLLYVCIGAIRNRRLKLNDLALTPSLT